MPSRRRTWFLVRMIIYLVVIAILLVNRGEIPWRRLAGTFRQAEQEDPLLRVGGRDLAPRLIDRLLAGYRQDYPDLALEVRSGGTNQALEDLINGRVDVAFLYRPPTPAEQDLFRETAGDTAVVTPVAVGAVLVLAAEGDRTDPLTPAGLAGILAGRTPGPAGPVYLPDPNEGLWDAVRSGLGLPGDLPPAGSPVVFLAGPDAVLAAVRDTGAAGLPGAWCLVSGLALSRDPGEGAPDGLKFLPMQAGPDSAAAAPAYETVATGTYPLHHLLYAACLDTGGRQGGRFVTHLASARGLRQVERAGVVPARQILREIHLSRDPVGE
ncbi:MAG: PstS family phosphate ABC transporter substrate-binding protein [Candidatus Krumholzibacteriia bacterium]